MGNIFSSLLESNTDRKVNEIKHKVSDIQSEVYRSRKTLSQAQSTYFLQRLNSLYNEANGLRLKSKSKKEKVQYLQERIAETFQLIQSRTNNCLHQEETYYEVTSERQPKEQNPPRKVSVELFREIEDNFTLSQTKITVAKDQNNVSELKTIQEFISNLLKELEGLDVEGNTIFINRKQRLHSRIFLVYNQIGKNIQEISLNMQKRRDIYNKLLEIQIELSKIPSTVCNIKDQSAMNKLRENIGGIINRLVECKALDDVTENMKSSLFKDIENLTVKIRNRSAIINAKSILSDIQNKSIQRKVNENVIKEELYRLENLINNINDDDFKIEKQQLLYEINSYNSHVFEESEKLDMNRRGQRIPSKELVGCHSYSQTRYSDLTSSSRGFNSSYTPMDHRKLLEDDKVLSAIETTLNDLERNFAKGLVPGDESILQENLEKLHQKYFAPYFSYRRQTCIKRIERLLKAIANQKHAAMQLELLISNNEKQFNGIKEKINSFQGTLSDPQFSELSDNLTELHHHMTKLQLDANSDLYLRKEEIVQQVHIYEQILSNKACENEIIQDVSVHLQYLKESIELYTGQDSDMRKNIEMEVQSIQHKIDTSNIQANFKILLNETLVRIYENIRRKDLDIAENNVTTVEMQFINVKEDIDNLQDNSKIKELYDCLSGFRFKLNEFPLQPGSKLHSRKEKIMQQIDSYSGILKQRISKELAYINNKIENYYGSYDEWKEIAERIRSIQQLIPTLPIKENMRTLLTQNIQYLIQSLNKRQIIIQENQAKNFISTCEINFNIVKQKIENFNSDQFSTEFNALNNNLSQLSSKLHLLQSIENHKIDAERKNLIEEIQQYKEMLEKKAIASVLVSNQSAKNEEAIDDQSLTNIEDEHEDEDEDEDEDDMMSLRNEETELGTVVVSKEKTMESEEKIEDTNLNISKSEIYQTENIATKKKTKEEKFLTEFAEVKEIFERLKVEIDNFVGKESDNKYFELDEYCTRLVLRLDKVKFELGSENHEKKRTLLQEIYKYGDTLIQKANSEE